MKKVAKELGINYPVLMGTPRVAETYGIRGIPATWVIDKKKIIRKRYIGPIPFSEFQKDAESLL